MNLAALLEAQALLDSGRADEALAIAGREAAGDPDDVPALILMANACLALARYDEALLHAGRAVRIDPSSREALQTVAFGHLARRDLLEALEAARGCVRLEPENWVTHVNLSTIARAGHRRSVEAFHAATRAIELAPDIPETHRAMGSLWYGRENWRAAVFEYRMALRIDPFDEKSELLMTHAIREAGRLSDAAVDFARMSALNPLDASLDHNLRITLGDLLFRSMGGVALAFLIEATGIFFLLAPGNVPWAVRLGLLAIALTAAGLVLASLRRASRQLGRRFPAMLEYLRRRDPLLLVWAGVQAAALVVMIIAPLLPLLPMVFGFLGVLGLLIVANVVWAVHAASRGRQ